MAEVKFEDSEHSHAIGHGKLWEIAWTEAAGGAAAGAVADGVLYGIDSAKVRAQSTPVGNPSDIRILFRGMGPTILLGSVPVFARYVIRTREIIVVHVPLILCVITSLNDYFWDSAFSFCMRLSRLS
jgi:hypothetical protein